MELQLGAINIISMLLSSSSFINKVLAKSCGIDNSPNSEFSEGPARIETYPWLGTLYYPYYQKRLTTVVVLVTRQIVLATATDIDKLPKSDFRARARVILGRNCSGPDIGIRDYSYHPDYSRDTYSALALVQLETDHVRIELRPICPPPSHFEAQPFYAMVLSNSCKTSNISIHKMSYVSPEDCRSYYRRTGLDVDTLWPSHTACAKSSVGGRCVWRSGAILVVKSNNRWRLLGFGVYGPGCEAPARFLDYGMYHSWVKRSVQRIGRPAVTTLDTNYIVFRRTLNNLQRFGPCDAEEKKHEMYSDQIKISNAMGRHRYNVTILSNMEYSCMVLKAHHDNSNGSTKPQIKLRRWCARTTGTAMCRGFGVVEIDMYAELKFIRPLKFDFLVYGRPAKILDPGLIMQWQNTVEILPLVDDYNTTVQKYALALSDQNNPWYTYWSPPAPPAKKKPYSYHGAIH